MSQRVEWSPGAIRDLRKRLGLTQEDLAARLGVRATTVHRWERNHNRPQRVYERQLDDLAKAID